MTPASGDLERKTGDRRTVVALEPWLGGSHRQFLEQWQARSRHDVRIVGLSPRHWRWRMRSSAWELARRTAGEPAPDCLLVSDYLDLPAFLGSVDTAWARVPVAAYFHENQLTFPSAPGTSDEERERDRHLAWTNVLTVVRADACVFNSRYHAREFGDAAREWLRILPKPNPRAEFLAKLEEARVISPGLDLEEIPLGRGGPGNALRIAFNQRFEHDKNPAGFLRAVRSALEETPEIELCLLGQRFEDLPEGVAPLLEELAPITVHSGFAETREEYARHLAESDVVCATSHHEFFGIAVCEALAAGCAPLCPDRLAYPEVIPREHHAESLYQDEAGLVARLVAAARDPRPLRDAARRARWREVAATFDAPLVAEELDRLVDELSQERD